MAYDLHRDSEDYDRSTDEAEFAGEYLNNQQLQKAIQYMLAEGNGDSLDLYLERIQIINEHLLQHYPRAGKAYDPTLYRRLQAMVREVQNDVRNIGEEASSLASDSDSSVNVLYRDDDSNILDTSSVEEIYRENDPGVESSSLPRAYQTNAAEPSKIRKNVSWAPSPRGLRGEDELEKQFLYGGPDNDPEKWYKGLPPILPFGETPYMERWESMKMNYDLNEFANEVGDDVTTKTNVPYKDVEPKDPRRSFLPSTLDSGSRFKLPSMHPNHWSRHLYHGPKLQALLPRIVSAFNAGGPLQQNKNYVPRIFLPKLRPIGFKNKPKRQTPSRGHATTSGRTGTSTRAIPPTTLNKFAHKRELAARRDSAARKKIPSASKAVRTSTPRFAPRTSTANGPPGTPKRGPGRPRKIVDPSYHPPRKPSMDDEEPQTPPRRETEELLGAGPATPRKVRHHKGVVDKNYRPSQSPLTPVKRKRDLNMDYDEHHRKSKAPRKKGSVGFVGEEHEPASLAKPSRRAAPLKSAIKKTKRISPEERDILNAAKAISSPKKRGTTRSGAVEFKPLRLRSADKTKK